MVFLLSFSILPLQSHSKHYCENASSSHSNLKGATYERKFNKCIVFAVFVPGVQVIVTVGLGFVVPLVMIRTSVCG